MNEAMEVFVDGRAARVAAGSSILAACAQAGVAVPTLCHLEGVCSDASCGICAVECPAGAIEMVPEPRG